MDADIFYAIFTLKITVLACFIQKHWGPCLNQGMAPPYAQLQKKKKKKKKIWCTLIFSELSTEYANKNELLFFSNKNRLIHD